MPKSKLALSEPIFTVMISNLPSPFISPRFTEYGLVPVAKGVIV